MHAESPSLRRPPDAGGAASKAKPFYWDQEVDNSLPDLLVAAVMGQREYASVMAIYCRLNKRMQHAANDKLDEWLGDLTEKRDAMLGEERALAEATAKEDVWLADQHDREAAIHMINVQDTMTGAFGDDFVTTYGEMALHCSLYSRKVFTAMLRRRCAICHRPGRSFAGSGTNPFLRDQNEACFTFAHAVCQRRHCIVLCNRVPIAEALEHSSSEKTVATMDGGDAVHRNTSIKDEATMITAGFKPGTARGVWKSLAVYHLSSEHKFQPSNLWRSIDEERRARRPAHASDAMGQVHWVQPVPDVVKREDTLVGALAVPDAAVDLANDKAVDYARIVQQRKQLREEERARRDEERRVERRGQMIARVGLMHSQGLTPWPTLEDVARVHSRAVGRVGVEEWINHGTVPGQPACRSLASVSDRLVYLSCICHNPPIDPQTLDYVMQCDEWWDGGQHAHDGSRHNDRLVSFVKFLDCMTIANVRVDSVSFGWRVKLSINGIATTITTCYDSLRRVRAYLETIGCTQKLPNLLLAMNSSSGRQDSFRAIVQCALETPLKPGVTNRSWGRPLAYRLLKMDQLLPAWLREAPSATHGASSYAVSWGHIIEGAIDSQAEPGSPSEEDFFNE